MNEIVIHARAIRPTDPGILTKYDWVGKGFGVAYVAWDGSSLGGLSGPDTCIGVNVWDAIGRIVALHFDIYGGAFVVSGVILEDQETSNEDDSDELSYNGSQV